ncbi:2-phospho-L-lactate guanylyltransferase [Aquipuribacter sp. SD81]|uniref:2-phospho-L-lactate guanylyltransferase n=1 Tax=Aquipuribacter sp. SD81 TaxID=3127703 RepID=UPI00301693CE
MSAPAATAHPGWTVVLPVKGGPGAKSRLVPPGPARRADLARAVALDTVAAVLACRAPDGPVADVVVVTADEPTAREHAALGARVVRDPGSGLDAAVLAGAATARPDRPCAVLLADLPSLRPDELVETLAGCARLLAGGAGQVVVPDADGTGTSLLAASRPQSLRPSFGAGSAARHEALGARRLREAPWGVRHDVDTLAQLTELLEHGTGARTTEAAGALRGAAQPRSTIAPSAASLSPKCS